MPLSTAKGNDSVRMVGYGKVHEQEINLVRGSHRAGEESIR
jgi:hypothetical protein